MTRKDYVRLARKLAELRELHDPAPWNGSIPFHAVVHGIAQALKDDNQNFDRDRFVEACYKLDRIGWMGYDARDEQGKCD